MKGELPCAASRMYCHISQDEKSCRTGYEIRLTLIVPQVAPSLPECETYLQLNELKRTSLLLFRRANSLQAAGSICVAECARDLSHLPDSTGLEIGSNSNTINGQYSGSMVMKSDSPNSAATKDFALKDWGFIFKGDGYEKCTFDAGRLRTRIAGVTTIEEAVKVAKSWADDGVQLIELCGWFQKEGATQLLDAVGERVAIGYVIPAPETSHLMARIFGTGTS